MQKGEEPLGTPLSQGFPSTKIPQRVGPSRIVTVWLVGLSFIPLSLTEHALSVKVYFGILFLA